MFNYGLSLEEVSEDPETGVEVEEVIPHKPTGKADRMHRSIKARNKRQILKEKQGREHAKGYKGSK